MQSPRHALLLLGAGLAAVVATGPVSTQSIESYGKGTGGTFGKVPFLWVNSMPRPGNTAFGLTIERGRASGLAIPFVSFRETQINIGGVNILIDFSSGLQLPVVYLDGAGKGTSVLRLPNVPSLIGTAVSFQAFSPDPGGAALGFSATQGLRVAILNSELLLGTRSTGAMNSPQIAINLDTGVQSTFSSANMSNIGIPNMYPLGGTHCIAGSGRTNRVALFDCQVFPPVFVQEFGSNLTPWNVTWNPDGIRLYVVNQSSTQNQPSIDVYWGLPGAANFGTPYAGGSIPLGNVIDAMRIEFTSDGNLGILSTLGLFGGGADLRKYDTRPNSPTYHQILGNYKRPGMFMWDMCRIDDENFAINEGGFGGYSSIKIIDINTMTPVQIFGGFGTVVRGLVADGRLRYLYVGNSPSGSTTIVGAVVRINIDTADPRFGSMATFSAGIKSGWGVYDVEVNDAGDRIYAIVGKGIQATFVGAINEYDTKTLGLLRSWKMDGLGNLYNLLIR